MKGLIGIFSMITYLLLGVTAGIILCAIFLIYIDPIIQLALELHNFKVNDTATFFNVNTQKQTFEFYRQYPEAKPEGDFQENINAIGFQIDPSEDDEDDYEDRMGFKI